MGGGKNKKKKGGNKQQGDNVARLMGFTITSAPSNDSKKQNVAAQSTSSKTSKAISNNNDYEKEQPSAQLLKEEDMDTCSNGEAVDCQPVSQVKENELPGKVAGNQDVVDKWDDDEENKLENQSVQGPSCHENKSSQQSRTKQQRSQNLPNSKKEFKNNQPNSNRYGNDGSSHKEQKRPQSSNNSKLGPPQSRQSFLGVSQWETSKQTSKTTTSDGNKSQNDTDNTLHKRDSTSRRSVESKSDDFRMGNTSRNASSDRKKSQNTTDNTLTKRDSTPRHSMENRSRNSRSGNTSNNASWDWRSRSNTDNTLHYHDAPEQSTENAQMGIKSKNDIPWEVSCDNDSWNDDFTKKRDHVPKQNDDNTDFESCRNFITACPTYKKVTEIHSDLFELSKEYSLAHCVAEDMSMGSGIAVHFRRDFKRVDELYAQKQKQGGLAVLEDNGRFIYYLVTKKLSNGKPTLQTLFDSLVKMQKHVKDSKVQKVGMPRIGCGLDRLEWSTVKPMIEYVFRNTEVQITVCDFQQPEQDQTSDTQTVPQKLRKCLVTNVAYPLVDIEGGTIIIYLGFEDGFVSSQMEQLDNKFRFVSDYRSNKRVVGDIITSYKSSSQYVLCAFIIKKDHRDAFDFINFQKCVVALNKWNSKKDTRYGYVGLEAFLDDDYMLMTKIVNLLRYGLRDVEVYVCWPGDLEQYMPRYN